MMNIKVGVMPGKLIVVSVEKGTKAREIFEMANIEVSNHEVRLDGNKINMDDTVENGRLLVAMKMIKGNMPNIKVGIMPGRLTTVEVEEGTTARQVFEMTQMMISDHEIRLDGNKIDLDTDISNGSLCVAMKKIKGNAKGYVSILSEEEIHTLIGLTLPASLSEDKLTFEGETVLINLGNEEVCINEDEFFTIYDEIDFDELPTKEEVKFATIEPLVADIIQTGKFNIPTESAPELRHVCTCNSAIKVMKQRFENEMAEYERWNKIASEHYHNAKLIEEMLREVESNM